MISYEWQDRLWLGSFIAIVVLIFGGAIYGCIQDNKQWNAFSAQHHCKLVSHISGSDAVTTGVGANGQVVAGVTSIPGKDGFLCDDGITYFRDN